MDILKRNMANPVAKAATQKPNRSEAENDKAAIDFMPWVVFGLCFLCSAVGVALSFLAFGSSVTGVRLWGIGFAVAIVMLGISYGAKYASEDARKVFTPVDLIQYVSQGFLWPSTWPALADLVGIDNVIPGPDSAVLQVLPDLLAVVLNHFNALT